jgi:polyribonucleotide nucleotidyltransferase
MPYSCFVEFLPGKEGLLHISEIDWKRFETMEETGIKEGDELEVKLLDIDPKTGKFKLSRRALLEKPEGYVERPERPARGEKGGRGERGERGDRRERRGHGDRSHRQESRHSDAPKGESTESSEIGVKSALDDLL